MTEKSAYPSDQADKVLVRMPEGMRDSLKRKAKVNNRTLNAEIVLRLQQSMQIDQATPELILSDPAVQRIAAGHMYTASVELMKSDPEFKKQMAEVFATAVVMAAEGRNKPSDQDLKVFDRTKSSKKPADN